MELIVNIARDRKTTLLVVEHDMQVVFSISEHIVVLHQGEVIADGLPEEVRKDIEVQKCYLGENV
jgi:branched-chain amino acid transport system ATP-binding protein